MRSVGMEDVLGYGGGNVRCRFLEMLVGDE